MALVGIQILRFRGAELDEGACSRACLRDSSKTLLPCSALKDLLTKSSKLANSMRLRSWRRVGLSPLRNLACFLASVVISSWAYRARRLNYLTYSCMDISP